MNDMMPRSEAEKWADHQTVAGDAARTVIALYDRLAAVDTRALLEKLAAWARNDYAQAVQAGRNRKHTERWDDVYYLGRADMAQAFEHEINNIIEELP